MDKVLLLIAAFLCSLSIAHAEIVSLSDSDGRTANSVDVNPSRDGQEIHVQFQLKSMDVNADEVEAEGQFFNQIDFQLPKTSRPGFPQRPFYSILVQSSPEEFSVKVHTGEGKQFEQLLLAPAEKMPCRCDNKEPESRFENEGFLSENQTFFVKEFLGDFRGIPVTRVIFFPAKVDLDHGLTVYPEIQFKLESTTRNSLREFRLADTLNEERAGSKMLILAAKSYHSEFAKYIVWKKKQNIDIDLIAIEDVGNSAEKIQKFLHARYKNEKTRFQYAILVGHEKNLPTFYVKTDSSDETPSDLPYYTMGGSDDFIPEVFYGRFAVNDKSELQEHLNKILAYESLQYDRTDGIKKHMGIASNEGSNPSDWDYVQDMAKPFNEKFGLKSTLYFQDDKASTVENINAQFSSGLAWVNYIGHGTGQEWPSINGHYYHVDDVAKIVSGGVQPVIVDVACQNGRLATDDRLGVGFMNGKNKDKAVGSVAYYGGSVDISWHPPAIMAVGINKAIAADKLQVLGPALLAGQIYLSKQYTYKPDVIDNFKWYHLQGDPSLKLPFVK